MSKSSFLGNNTNDFSFDVKSSYYNWETREWVNQDPIGIMIYERSEKFQSTNSTFNGEPLTSKIDQPLHHLFLTTIAIEIYDYAKTKGASPMGALIVLAQASLESLYGSDALKNKDYNLFGVMGTPSKRKTTHGSVKDYSNLGGYKAAITDYFNRIEKKWPYFSTVISQNTITADDIDKGLNTGKYYPTPEENFKGKYTYNSDMGKDKKNHYGEIILKQVGDFKKRFVRSLEYQIKQNKKIIGEVNHSAVSINPYINNGAGTTVFNFEMMTLFKQNETFTAILNEIN
ncbi:hypothetical protein Q1W71_22935 [Flavobacterium pectinovorum]|uniref:hypothetical protein n=1 Tax=Flavobacterium pectinovorum TaxID=29533 RepID=UPI00265FF8E5|nr:hypothetical protein [Flavobacterium pectinovorum]WKL47790.1 hypothetical protein Q1W71_22935 [Flavobacterium pectinovorum]